MPHRWITDLALVSVWICLFPPGVVAQDRQALIDVLTDSPSWTIQANLQHFVDDSIREILGDDTEPAHDYEVIGISEFVVTGTESNAEVGVTLFEMFDSTAAFGLFAIERSQQAADFRPAVVGTESYRQGERLVLWQSNFIAMLQGPAEAAEAIGALLVDNIFGSSRKAPVSTFLPREGLVTDSEKYILTPEAFEKATGINPNQLGFDDSAEAAVAEYESPGGGTMLLAMLLYPTQHLASLHLDAWLEDTPNERPNRRSGPLLAIAATTDDRELTESVLDALRYQSEVTWNEPLPDPLTLPYLILTIFTWIGIALGFTLVAGFGYGGYRIYMKTRYPDRFLGASPRMELIQLNINQRVTPKQLRR